MLKLKLNITAVWCIYELYSHILRFPINQGKFILFALFQPQELIKTPLFISFTIEAVFLIFMSCVH